MKLIDRDMIMDSLQKLYDRRQEDSAATGNRGPAVTWNDTIYCIKTAKTIDAAPWIWIEAFAKSKKFDNVESFIKEAKALFEKMESCCCFFGDNSTGTGV